MDTLCNTNDKRRASSAINEFLELAKKAGRNLADVVRDIVDLYPARVLKGFDFTKQNAPQTRLGSSKRFNKIVSATETELEDSLPIADGNDKDRQTNKNKAPKRKSGESNSADGKDNSKRASDAASVEISVPLNNHPLPEPLAQVAVDIPNGLNSVPVSHAVVPKAYSNIALNIYELQIVFGDDLEGDLDPVADPPPQRQASSKSSSSAFSDADLQLLHQRIKSMGTRYSKVYESVNGSLVYLCGCVEKLTNDTNELKDMVKSINDRSMAEKLLEKPFEFPLKSRAEVESYLQRDPTANAALER